MGCGFLIIFLYDGHKPENRPIAFLPANGEAGNGAALADNLDFAASFI